MLLLARLGLRAGEVVRLNLEDIDWENGVIRIRRKGGRWTPLPLLNDVGEALATYLHSGRPQSCCRRVFLRHRAPVSGFAHTITVSSIVRRLLIRTGVDSARTGAQGHPEVGVCWRPEHVSRLVHRICEFRLR
jgi:integrase